MTLMFKRTPQIGGFLDAVETVVNYLQSAVHVVC